MSMRALGGALWGAQLVQSMASVDDDADSSIVLEDISRRICLTQHHVKIFCALFNSYYCRHALPAFPSAHVDHRGKLTTVQHLQAALSDVCNDHDNSRRKCGDADCCASCGVERPLVALDCNDGLLLALAEMSCLMLGVPFHPQSPSDPPARKEFLQRRFHVACALHEGDLEGILQDTMRLVKSPPLAWRDVVDVDVPDHFVAYVVTTSGSSGEPKGVVAQRGNLRAYVEGFVAAVGFPSVGLGVTSTSRLLLLSSCTFDPSIADIATALHVLSCHRGGGGGRLLCASRADITSSLANVLAAANPTHVVSTPALWQTVAASSMERLASSWTNASGAVVALGGEAMPPSLISQWAHVVKLFNIYGVTEVTVYQTLQRIAPPGEGAVVAASAAGKATGSVTVTIDAFETADCDVNDTLAEAEDLRCCPQPRTPSVPFRGEVVLSGPQVCRGYFTDVHGAVDGGPFVRHAAADCQRSFRTGDAGELTKDGTLLLFGRRDTMVKLNGQRVALAEVEHTLLAAIGETYISQLVCGVLNSSSANLCAVVATRPLRLKRSPSRESGASSEEMEVVRSAPMEEIGELPSHLWAQALLGIAEQLLPRHMIPVQWLVLPRGTQLPCTSSGKVARAQALSFIDARGANHVSAATDGESQQWKRTLSPLGSIIACEWEKLFLVPMKPSSDFFRLGGDSLSALKMTRAVYLSTHDGDASGIDAFGVMPEAYRPQHLTQNSTLSEYVAFLEHRLATEGCHDAQTMHPTESLSEALSDETDHHHFGDGDGVERIVEPAVADDVDNNASKRAGALLLMEAVDVGDAQLVAMIIDPAHSIAGPNGLSSSKTVLATTPLHMAVASRHIDVVHVLLAGGAKVTAVNQDGVSAAHIAAMNQTTDAFLRTLIKHGFPPEARDKRQQSLLHVAARFGSAVCARYLLVDCRINPGTRDCWQRTAAHWAVLNGHQAVLQILVDPRWQDETLYKVQVRRGGKSTRSRSARLAHRRTHLAYESVAELAVRLYGHDSPMATLAVNLVD